MSAELEITFRLLARSDFARLREWLNTPHVYEWWGRQSGPDGLGGPGADAATDEEIEADYGRELDAGGPTHPFVILVDGEPAGMIQWYRLDAYPDYAAEIGESEGVAIDLFLGEPSRVGRGFGPHVIQSFAEYLRRTTCERARVVAGPDVRNLRSIRAFEKAGFRWVRDAAVTGEPADEHVMVFDDE